jgi:hypothetical protein
LDTIRLLLGSFEPRQARKAVGITEDTTIVLAEVATISGAPTPRERAKLGILTPEGEEWRYELDGRPLVTVTTLGDADMVLAIAPQAFRPPLQAVVSCGFAMATDGFRTMRFGLRSAYVDTLASFAEPIPLPEVTRDSFRRANRTWSRYLPDSTLLPKTLAPVFQIVVDAWGDAWLAHRRASVREVDWVRTGCHDERTVVRYRSSVPIGRVTDIGDGFILEVRASGVFVHELQVVDGRAGPAEPAN